MFDFTDIQVSAFLFNESILGRRYCVAFHESNIYRVVYLPLAYKYKYQLFSHVPMKFVSSWGI